METISQYPVAILIGVGLLVLSNLGVIITFITFIFKAGMFVSETKAGIAKAQETAVRAHRRIDDLESRDA